MNRIIDTSVSASSPSSRLNAAVRSSHASRTRSPSSCRHRAFAHSDTLSFQLRPIVSANTVGAMADSCSYTASGRSFEPRSRSGSSAAIASTSGSSSLPTTSASCTSSGR